MKNLKINTSDISKIVLTAIYDIADDSTFTERFASYKEAYNWFYSRYGALCGHYTIIKVED